MGHCSGVEFYRRVCQSSGTQPKMRVVAHRPKQIQGSKRWGQVCPDLPTGPRLRTNQAYKRQWVAWYNVCRPFGLLPLETCENQKTYGRIMPYPRVRQNGRFDTPRGGQLLSIYTMKHSEMSLMANWCMWHKFRGFEWNARPGAQRPLSISMANDRRRNH